MPDKDGFISFDNSELDPDVRGTIRAGRDRQVARREGAARSSAGASSKKAEKDAARNRRMIDLPKDLEQRLEHVADELHVPVSSLIVWLVDRSLNEVSMDEIADAREPSRSMRFEYILRIAAQPRKVKKIR